MGLETTTKQDLPPMKPFMHEALLEAEQAASDGEVPWGRYSCVSIPSWPGDETPENANRTRRPMQNSS